MPLLLDTASRTDIIASAVSRLIAEGGLAAVTIRSISAATGVSPASLTHQLTNRARLMTVVGRRTGQAMLRDIVARHWTEGVLAFLPAAVDDVTTARVWLAWCELARADDGLRPHVMAIEQDERALFARELGEPVGDDDLDLGIALVRGLRHAVCTGDEPMPVERARGQLLRWAEPYLSEAASARARSSATIRSGSSAE